MEEGNFSNEQRADPSEGQYLQGKNDYVILREEARTHVRTSKCNRLTLQVDMSTPERKAGTAAIEELDWFTSEYYAGRNTVWLCVCAHI